jgi:hypothetical protein
MGETLLSDAKVAVLRQCCRAVKDLHGMAAEVGVYKGGSLAIIVEELPKKLVRGYDTFEGLPAPSKEDEPARLWTGKYAVPMEAAAATLPDSEYVELVCGRFPVLGEPAHMLCNVVFAHVDVDLYHETGQALMHLVPRMAPGGIILVDDFGNPGAPGVERAVRDVLHDRAIALPSRQALWVAR